VKNEAAEQRIRAHFDAGDFRRAATELVRAYGPMIVGYLRSVVRDEDIAADLFSTFSEHMWNGIAKFRGESAFSTWSYRVAWGAVRRFADDPYRKRRRAFETGEASRLAEEVRSTTALHLKTEVKDAVTRLRESLTPEEQTLLFLRVDRKLAWKEVAEIMGELDPGADAATLRKRFERTKSRLREMAEAAGLLGRS
jgi:RNA polymerase sigma-70 factor (ECF subfamily)